MFVKYFYVFNGVYFGDLYLFLRFIFDLVVGFENGGLLVLFCFYDGNFLFKWYWLLVFWYVIKK